MNKNTEREFQGNLPLKKRQELRFNHTQSFLQKRILLGSHFVKMSMVGYYFRINPDNTILKIQEQVLYGLCKEKKSLEG